MRKILLGLMCGLLVVGIANMGHAFLFFGGGGGGGNKSKASGPSLDVGALFNHDFHQFGVDPNKDDNLTLPDQGSNDFAWNHDGPGFDFDRNDWRNEDSGPGGQNGAAVPEPATVLLLGIGLLGLAGYGRKMLKK